MRAERRRTGRANRAASRSRRARSWPRTWRGSSASTRRSTPSSRSWPSGAGRRGQGRRADWRAAIRSACCTACRSRTRISSTRRASARRCGSPFYRDHVPTHDALIVTRMRAAGAITVRQDEHAGVRRRIADVQRRLRRDAQSLRPDEDVRRQQRRRGGGAGAAACCRSPTAATPAARCATPPPSATSSAFGRRRAACRARPRSWSPLSVSGPMARSVADVALFLSAIAGPDPRSPLSIAEDPARFRAPLGTRLQGRARRVVARARRHSRSSRRFARVVDGNRRVFEDLGCIVEEAEPDFAGVDEAFPALRFAANHAQYAPLVRQRPEWVKDTIKYEVAAGRADHRRGRRAGAGAAGADVRAEPPVLRALRLLRPAGDAGRAVRRQHAVSDRRSPARR